MPVEHIHDLITDSFAAQSSSCLLALFSSEFADESRCGEVVAGLGLPLRIQGCEEIPCLLLALVREEFENGRNRLQKRRLRSER